MDRREEEEKKGKEGPTEEAMYRLYNNEDERVVYLELARDRTNGVL